MIKSSEYDKQYQKQYYINNREKVLIRTKQWRQNNKEKMDEYEKQYYAKNKEKINIRCKQWQLDNPEKGVASRLKRSYGITIEQYNKMLIKQDFKCAICGKHQSELKRALHVDHDHEIDEIRGLLCQQCNAGLGFLKDDPKIIEGALNYINKINKPNPTSK